MTSFPEPLIMPTAPEARRRGPLPILASIVPVVGGVVMWLVTGSLLGLCFAALGPLMAIASLIDGARTARRDRRLGERELAIARTRIEGEMAARHSAEREVLDARHPDAAVLLQRPERVWRPVPGAADVLVVGRGRSASSVRVVGGDEQLRGRAARLDDAPVTVPMGAGVCVRGPGVISRAVLRALVVQLCLAHDPEALTIVAAPSADEEWLSAFPHRAASGTGVASLRLAVVGPGDPVPPGTDVVLAHAEEGATPPTRCAALVTLTAPGRGEVSWDGGTSQIDVECVSEAQARSVARSLARRAADAAPAEVGAVDLAVVLGSQRAPLPGLSAAIGMEGLDVALLDLVADGPHAVVAGVTGSGKSELLITWVTSLCAAHSTHEVSFLLADFKGGTAFDSLAALPHVTGVITDLDAGGSRRAVESLRAELRWREGELARVGARDILDARVRMPRLVIVVDEFAAMLAEHPDLHAVFTDVGARGRALGMHLVLGTQRVSGVVRDALLANCPLRISLRVTDAADSRAVVGSDDASRLPGGAASRGLAYVRRPVDAQPRLVRVALSSADDIRGVVEARADEPRPRRPWLPALPTLLRLEDLPDHPAASETGGSLRLGLTDDPERQRQDVVAVDPGRDRGLVVVGGPASGKTGVVELIAAQRRDAVVVPPDPEQAWDVLHADLQRRAVLLIDDVDALLARFPADHARAMLDRLEAIAREAAATGTYVVLTAQRLTGALARIVEPLPSRAVLSTTSRSEHIAAGGEPDGFIPWRPPGRARFAGRELQFARVPTRSGGAALAGAADRGEWAPVTELTGVVTRGVRRTLDALTAAWDARVVSLDRLAPGMRVDDVLLDAGGAATVLVGDADSWQSHWGLLQALRTRHPLLVDAACSTELRTIAGERELPPYARPGAGRAWLCGGDGPPRRVILPQSAAEAWSAL